MTIDRRIKKTRDALSDALLSLLPTTPLNKITIKSIVDIANVSRSTFYVHFDDVFDLYDQTVNELLAGLVNQITADYPDLSEDSFSLLVSNLVSYIDDHKHAFVVLTQSALMSRLWTGFFSTARCRYPEIFSKPGFQPKMA